MTLDLKGRPRNIGALHPPLPTRRNLWKIYSGRAPQVLTSKKQKTKKIFASICIVILMVLCYVYMIKQVATFPTYLFFMPLLCVHEHK